MPNMAEIGRQIQIEQNLSDADTIWLVAMAQAVLRAFTWKEG